MAEGVFDLLLGFAGSHRVFPFLYGYIYRVLWGFRFYRFFCRVWVYKIQRVGLGFRFSGFRVFGLRVSFEGDDFSRVLYETAAVTRGILFVEQQASRTTVAPRILRSLVLRHFLP